MKKLFFLLLLLCAGYSAQAQSTVHYDLWARNYGNFTLHDGNVIRIFGFAPDILNPWLPGPVLTANEGDTLEVWLFNFSQGAPHTIHWHGLDVDQENDGVPQTSWTLSHQEDSTYRFVVDHAGTYLYHCHVASIVHVQMGMYGNVVVKAAGGANEAWTGGPSYHRDYLWLMSEIDKSWHDTLPPHNTNDSVWATFRVPPYEPDYFLVSGQGQQQIAADSSVAVFAEQNERLYMRLSNVGFLENEVIFPASVNAEIIASDGRPLPNSIVSDTLRMTPGERYGVMIVPSQQGSFTATVNYLDMNTGAVKGTESIPIEIDGILSSEPGVREPEIALYPNPAQGVLTLQWQQWDGGTAKMRFYDMSGRMVESVEWHATQAGLRSFLLPGLPGGLYVVEVDNGSRTWRERVMIAQ